MSVWGRIKGFVEKIEKSIDNEFVPENKKNEKSDIAIPALENIENGDIAEKPGEKDVNEDENIKKERLICLIANIEKEIDQNNIELTKLIRVSDIFGASGELLHKEFIERSTKLLYQIDKFRKMEEESICDNSVLEHHILECSQLQTDLSKKQAEKNAIENEYTSLCHDFTVLSKQKKDLEADLKDLNDKEPSLIQQKDALYLEIASLDNQKNNLKVKIEGLKSSIESIMYHVTSTQIELRSILSEKEKFVSNKKAYIDQIYKLQDQQSLSDQILEQSKKKNQEHIIESMKNYTTNALKDIEKKRKDVKELINKYNEERSLIKDKNINEIKELTSLLNSMDIEANELQIKLKSTECDKRTRS